MDDTTKAMIGSIIRTLIVTFGGGAVFSPDQITAAAGAIVVLGTLVWSLIQKKTAGDKLQAEKDLRS